MSAKLNLGTRPCAHCGKTVELKVRRDVKRKTCCSPRCRQLHRFAKSPWDMARAQVAAEGSDRRPVSKKSCDTCGVEYLPFSARQRWCHTCAPDKQARARIQRYGLTEPLFQKLLEQQGGQCGLCKRRITRNTAVVDHDHSCCSGKAACGACTRGLLCNRCNLGLHFVENSEWLSAAFDYLEEQE